MVDADLKMAQVVAGTWATSTLPAPAGASLDKAVLVLGKAGNHQWLGPRWRPDEGPARRSRSTGVHGAARACRDLRDSPDAAGLSGSGAPHHVARRLLGPCPHRQRGLGCLPSPSRHRHATCSPCSTRRSSSSFPRSWSGLSPPTSAGSTFPFEPRRHWQEFLPPGSSTVNVEQYRSRALVDPSIRVRYPVDGPPSGVSVAPQGLRRQRPRGARTGRRDAPGVRRATADRCHCGQSPRRSGLALVTGTADAVAAAIDWQQAEQDQPATSLALHVAEVTYRADAAEPASVALVPELAERGHPGDVLATEVVRMLLPTPAPAYLSDELATSIGQPAQLVHAIRWPRNVGAAPITVVVAEDVALVRAGLAACCATTVSASSVRSARSWPPCGPRDRAYSSPTFGCRPSRATWGCARRRCCGVQAVMRWLDQS